MNISPTISPEEQTTSQIMRDLAEHTPLNEFNFPLGIYRPDLLPLHDYKPEQEAVQELLDVDSNGDSDIPDSGKVLQTIRTAGLPQAALHTAFVPLHYDEGFPTLPSGQPVWEKFEFEPVDAYQCLQAYTQMPQVDNGTRSVAGLAQLMEANELLQLNGSPHEEYSQKFRIFMDLYNWNVRVRAYDIYKVAAHRKQMEIRSLDTVDDHYIKSTGLMKRLMEYMEDEEEFWEMMTPKVGIDLLKTLSAMQRISVGLPGSQPATEGGGVQGVSSFEVIMRSLAGAEGQEATTSELDHRLASKILSDPEATSIAQELIVRLELS